MAKNKFIEKLNKTNLFDNIDEGKKNSLNIIGKFNYKQKFLEIKEDNFCLCFLNKKENSSIFKYKDQTIYNEIKGEISKNCNLKSKGKKFKKNIDVILFSFEDDIKFLGLKRKRNSSDYNNI